MLALSLQGGTCVGSPDVCNTPSPGGPVPVPYPNITQLNMADSGSYAQKVYFSNMQALTKSTTISLSNGDNGGTAGGVASGTFMQKTQFTMGSFIVYVEGAPAVYQGSMTTHNNNNIVGSATVSAQVVVDIMG